MTASKPLHRDALRAYLEQTAFRLRPKDYDAKYPRWPGYVGLEIEMLPIVPEAPKDRVPAHPGRVRLHGPGGTSAAILRRLAAAERWATVETEDETGNPMLLRVDLDQGDNLSFEPGGQVEFSSKPHPCLAGAVKRQRAVLATLDRAFAEEGVRLVQVGVNPWHTVAELGLQMSKARYRAMDRYFAAIGPYGQRMMRQSCTIQMNLDFGADEATLVKRYVACQLLAPVATALFANSPVVDRAATGVPGFRSRIWRHTDPGRTGLPGLAQLAAAVPSLSRDLCIETYLEFALAAPVVFVTAADYAVPATPTTFGEWLTRPIAGCRPTLDDFAVHLTLLFPEVRPRGFLEIRSIDCQPRPFATVPAVYMTGILYDDRSLDRALELLLPRAAEASVQLARAERGLEDQAVGRLAEATMALAAEGFARQSPGFREGCSDRELAAFRERFTARGRTPADDILDRMRAERVPFLSAAGLAALEDEWAALIGC